MKKFLFVLGFVLFLGIGAEALDAGCLSGCGSRIAARREARLEARHARRAARGCAGVASYGCAGVARHGCAGVATIVVETPPVAVQVCPPGMICVPAPAK